MKFGLFGKRIRRKRKSFFFFFQKTLDKPGLLCYNNDRKKERGRKKMTFEETREIYRTFEKLVNRGADCYFKQGCNGMNLYLQSPTRKISKLIFEQMKKLNYIKDFEYSARSQIIFYFRSKEAPDLQLIFPKRIDKTKVIF